MANRCNNTVEGRPEAIQKEVGTAMKVTDLNGCPIEVTDLDETIRTTAEYKKYEHVSEGFSEFDKRQKAYWTDMYGKLTAIKEQLTATLKNTRQ